MYYEKTVDEKSYYLFYFGKHGENDDSHFTPPHCHDAYEILVVTHGCVDTVLNGEKKRLSAGDIFFADSYDIHSFFFENCERYSLVFSKDYCKMLLDGERTLPNYPVCDKKSFDDICLKLEQYYRIYGERIPNGLLVESLVSYVLGVIEFSCDRVKRTGKANETMVSVLDYINKNYANDLTLTSVATKFGYASSYFSSLFNRFVKMSFSDYLNYVRYNKATEMMQSEGCSATDIAMRCGFGSMNTFYRAKSKYEKNLKI